MSNWYVEAAREKYNLSDDWEWFKLEAIGPVKGPRATMIIGAVAPLKTRGKYKGYHDWKRRDKTTEIRCIVTEAEHTAFCLRYEAKTGNCHYCRGTGQEWAGWSAQEGDRYRICHRCKGDGKARKAEQAA